MGDDRKTEIERFDQAIQIIRDRFPQLRIEIDQDHPHVDALAEIPQQPGLDFDVGINLQNADELHLTAGHLWVEWFPCGDQEVFDQYVEAVIGILSGEYRIVESYVLGSAVTAQLQRPQVDGSWERVTGWGNLGCLVPLPRKRRIVQNSSGIRPAG